MTDGEIPYLAEEEDFKKAHLSALEIYILFGSNDELLADLYCNDNDIRLEWDIFCTNRNDFIKKSKKNSWNYVTHLLLFEIFREIVVEKADFTENDTIQVSQRGNHGKCSYFHKNFVKATFLLNE